MGTAIQYDGVNDQVKNTAFSPLSTTGDWTLGTWYWSDDTPGANETLIELMNSGNSGVVQWLYLTTTRIATRQLFATTNAQVQSNHQPTGQWNLAVGLYEHGTKTCTQFLGDMDTAMAEPTYTTDTAGTGARNTNEDYVGIGCNPNSATSRPFDGKMALAFCLPWAMTLNEAEAVRRGNLSPLWRGGQPRFVVMFGPNGVTDLASTANAWTLVGATETDGPAVRMRTRRGMRSGGIPPSGVDYVMAFSSLGGLDDVVSTATTYERVHSHVVGLTKALSRALEYARIHTHSEGGLDSVSKASGHERSWAKQMTELDSVTRVADHARTHGHLMGITKVLSRAVEAIRNYGRSEGLSDVVSKAGSSERAWAKALPTLDSIARNADAARSSTEGISGDDSLGMVLEYERSVTSSEGLDDLVARAVAMIVELQYDLGMLDSLAISTTLSIDYTFTFVDGVGGLDSFLRTWDGVFIQQDGLTESDVVSRSVQAVKTVLGSEGLLDSLIKTVAFEVIVADGLDADDWLIKISDYARTPAEAIALLDTLMRVASGSGIDIRLSAALVEGDRVIRATLTREMVMKLLEEL